MSDQSAQQKKPTYQKEEESENNFDNDAGLFDEEEESEKPQRLQKKKYVKQEQEQQQQEEPLRHKKISKDKSHTRKTEKKKRHRRSAPLNQRAVKTEQQQRLDQICKTKADSLIQTMKQTANIDIKRNKKGLGGAQKVIFSKTLAKDLQTEAVALYFLNNDGLLQFERWLRKLPDGSQPSFALKKECFNIFLNLPITHDNVDIVSKSSLKSLVQKHQSSKERQLKELAQKITFKWKSIESDRYYLYES